MTQPAADTHPMTWYAESMVGRLMRGVVEENVPKGAQGEVVPSARWSEQLASFTRQFKGAQVYIRVIGADGKPRRLDSVDLPDPENVDLRLMSLGEEYRNGERVVRLFAHQYPGAEIAQIEFAGAVRLTRREQGLIIGAADGCRMEVQVSGVCAANGSGSWLAD